MLELDRESYIPGVKTLTFVMSIKHHRITKLLSLEVTSWDCLVHCPAKARSTGSGRLGLYQVNI